MKPSPLFTTLTSSSTCKDSRSYKVGILLSSKRGKRKINNKQIKQETVMTMAVISELSTVDLDYFIFIFYLIFLFVLFLKFKVGI